ncbi:integral peroxisomal membrane peroxin-domain-containing protein [Cyathus striatus]|nr:integral peroxisomal membrane peroxin-domain-containing protein [Cyathus striatus]
MLGCIEEGGNKGESEVLNGRVKKVGASQARKEPKPLDAFHSDAVFVVHDALETQPNLSLTLCSILYPYIFWNDTSPSRDNGNTGLHRSTTRRNSPLSPPPSSSFSSSKTSSPTDIRPLPKISTKLPNPSPPSTPPPIRRRTTSAGAALSLSSSPLYPGSAAIPSSLTSPTLSFLPQLLLSSSLPSGVLSSASSPGKKNGNGIGGKLILLSNRDPLSLPIMTSNFKRFVAKVGPVFWLQDRVEEVLFWRRGWRLLGFGWLVMRFCVRGFVLLLYGYFPRMILLLPHLILIGIILSTYRYPPPPTPLSPSGSAYTVPPPPPPVASTTEDWQANIQAIQNLMGLYLGPLGAFTTPPPSSSSTSPSPAAQQRGGLYTPHILLLLLLTLPPLAFIVSLPAFPIRTVALLVGWAPFVATHPWVQALVPHLCSIVSHIRPKVVHAANSTIEFVEKSLEWMRRYAPWLVSLPSPQHGRQGEKKKVDEKVLSAKHVKMALRRWMDNEKLSDQCWNSEMRVVELWENERLAVDLETWTKTNLKPGERGPWTRGRDGWSGLGVGGVEAEVGVGDVGEVSSNLTFSLAPGWSFVDTEDWRKDLDAAWVECGGDDEGWVYTNDAWLGPRPAPYTSTGGSVTRRRRWLRRVFFDPGLVGYGDAGKKEGDVKVESGEVKSEKSALKADPGEGKDVGSHYFVIAPLAVLSLDG